MNISALKLIAKIIIYGTLLIFAALILYWLVFYSRWSWFVVYLPLLIKGLWLTIQLLVLSVVLGGVAGNPHRPGSGHGARTPGMGGARHFARSFAVRRCWCSSG